MFQLALGVVVIVMGAVLAGKPARQTRSRLRGRVSRANNVLAGVAVVLVGAVLALFGLLDLANNG